MHLKRSSGKWRPFLSRPQCVKGTRDGDTVDCGTCTAYVSCRQKVLSPSGMLVAAKLKQGPPLPYKGVFTHYHDSGIRFCAINNRPKTSSLPLPGSSDQSPASMTSDNMVTETP